MFYPSQGLANPHLTRFAGGSDVSTHTVRKARVAVLPSAVSACEDTVFRPLIG